MISIQLTGLDAVRARFESGLQRQIDFALARALTQTAYKVKEAIPGFLDQKLDRPTPWTKSGTYVDRATPRNLQATVGFKPIQSSYLRWQAEGGVRAPKRQALRLPSAIKLDAYGNLPRGIIAQLIAVARKESRLTKRKARRIQVSKNLDLFYGDPADVGGHKSPPGIYKIVKTGTHSRLIPLIVFPATVARYDKRFDLRDLARPIVAREYNALFNAALRDALSTAR